MAARSAFYDGVIGVDHWLIGTPPGGVVDGDFALLPTTGLTGAFVGHPGELGIYSAATGWRFILASGTPGLRGCLLFSKSGPTQHQFFGHDGTLPIGPLTARSEFTWLYAQGVALAPGAISIGLLVNNVIAGAGTAGFAVPASRSAMITSCAMNIPCGATAGTYTVDCVYQDMTGAETILATGTGTASAQIRVGAENRMTGLGTVIGANTVRIGWRNRASSPAALGGTNSSCWVTGFLI